MKKSKLVYLMLLSIIVLSCKKTDNENVIIKTKKEVSIDKKIPYGSKQKDTLVILDNNIIVFFEPNTKEIEELKKKHGEDNFYIIADDVSGYLANITEQLDLKKIKYITTDLKVVHFQNLGLFINKDELKSKWSILYTDKNKSIKKVSPIDFNINDIVEK